MSRGFFYVAPFSYAYSVLAKSAATAFSTEDTLCSTVSQSDSQSVSQSVMSNEVALFVISFLFCSVTCSLLSGFHSSELCCHSIFRCPLSFQFQS